MPMMQAAILRGLRDIVCDEVPVPGAGRPRRRSCGCAWRPSVARTCTTSTTAGRATTYPMEPGEPGHEGVGTIVDPGETDLREGALVLTVPNIWEARNFAEYQAVSPHFIIELPEGRPLGRVDDGPATRYCHIRCPQACRTCWARPPLSSARAAPASSTTSTSAVSARRGSSPSIRTRTGAPRASRSAPTMRWT